MPRPKVWGDFEEDEGFAAKDDAGDDLVEFTCPYNCGKPIRMKARNVIKNKCTECRSHLLKCSGVRSDGQQAEDDPRIHSIKIAAAECAEHMRAAKRGRATDGLPSTTTTPEEGENRALVALQLRNDELQHQKSSVEAQLADLSRKTQENDARLRAVERRLCDAEQWQEAMACAIGFTEKPVPALDVCLEQIERMKRGGALGVALGGADAQRSCRQCEHWKRQVDDQDSDLQRARKRFAERVAEAEHKFKLQNELFEPFQSMFADRSATGKASATRMFKYFKNVLRVAHPDKHQEHRAEAEMLTVCINTMRKRLNEKFKLYAD